MAKSRFEKIKERAANLGLRVIPVRGYLISNRLGPSYQGEYKPTLDNVETLLDRVEKEND